MRRFILAICLALPLMAQAQTTRIYLGVSQVVRDSLAREWDDTTAGQNERGYCAFARAGVVRTNDKVAGIMVQVDSLGKPDSLLDQKPQSLRIMCPTNTITLHTHPPATCDEAGKECVLGGDEANECFASDSDWDMLAATEADAGVIQCDRGAFIVYVNPDYIKKLFVSP